MTADQKKKRATTMRWIAYPIAIALTAGIAYGGFFYKAEPDVGSLLGSAQLYAQTGSLDEADKIIDRAIEREPNNMKAVLLKAFVCERRKNLDGAIKHYRKSLSLIDDEKVLLDVQLSIADLYRRQSEFKAAEQELDALEKVRGEMPQAWRMRGFIATNKSDEDEALLAFARYAELMPESSDAKCLHASAHIAMNQHSEARSLLSGIAETERVAWPSWLDLARSCLEAGDSEGAASALSRFRKLDPHAGKRLARDPFWVARGPEIESKEVLN